MSSELAWRVARRTMSLLLTCAFPLFAQGGGTVSGTLSLVERSDAERGDLRMGVVYLEPRGQRPPMITRASLQGATIAMRGREFMPHVRAVLVGGSISFPNEDPFSHNVFSNVELGPFDLGLYRRGASRTATFNRTGVYPIYCNIHSRMVSFVVAVPTPWAVQPDPQGRFRIADVPPGSYVLHAWHERGAGEQTRVITVASGATVDAPVTIDARAWVSGQHLNKFGRPYTITRADRY